MKRTLLSWLPFAIVVTIAGWTAWLVVQQVYRSSANDPQIQMAEDGAAKLGGGVLVPQVVPSETVDMARSLAPYVIVYNEMGMPVSGSARLRGQIPTLPVVAIEAARRQPELRLTWQPVPGVRSAVVVRHYGGANPGFLLAGRSLREIELRVRRFAGLLLLVWGASLVILLVYFGLATWLGRASYAR